MVDKVEKVMGEFKEGSLKSSSGHKVTDRKQAIAIALSEARKAGQKVKPAPKSSSSGHRGRSRTYKRGSVRLDTYES